MTPYCQGTRYAARRVLRTLRWGLTWRAMAQAAWVERPGRVRRRR